MIIVLLIDIIYIEYVAPLKVSLVTNQGDRKHFKSSNKASQIYEPTVRKN